jgi:hypothetical protein
MEKKRKGFALLRNGLLEHIEAGKLCPTDLGVYLYLLLTCNYRTGIAHTCALGIAHGFGDVSQRPLAGKALARLKKIGFINYPKGSGVRGNYDILIDKYEPKDGVWLGYRLNAWECEGNPIPKYSRASVEEQSSVGGASVGGESGGSGGGVEGSIQYYNTLRREEVKTQDLHTKQGVGVKGKRQPPPPASCKTCGRLPSYCECKTPAPPAAATLPSGSGFTGNFNDVSASLGGLTAAEYIKKTGAQ